jgi:hypothetical protein
MGFTEAKPLKILKTILRRYYISESLAVVDQKKRD